MKRLILSLAIVILVVGANVGLVSAQSNSSWNNIWAGLWAGSNFNVSGLSGRPATPPRTVNPPSSSGRYAALGDSVAAGLGLPSTATQCGRSTQAYPYQVARTLRLPLTHVACSGATAGDLFTNQGVSGPNIPPQLTMAYASGKPRVISITAGANDAQWVGFLRKCYVSTCGTAFDTSVANTYLSVLELKLHYLFYDIRSRSSGTPPVTVITGYYNPLSTVCTNLSQRLTPGELAWLNTEHTNLNRTIQNVASQFSYVRFAPVSFSGHDLCSTTPWVQGINDAAPFHPNAAGQQVIAQSVLRALGR